MSNEATVRRYFTCLDTEDWDGMRELWHEDGTMRAVGARPRVDREGVIEFFSGLFAPWPKHEDRPTRLVIAGDTILAEVTFTGTTPEGREVSFDAVDVFDLRDERITSLSNWYDVALARKLLKPQPTA
jgi:ketosteroid isomerase-like protein